jgi:hypothetical protein
MSLDVTIYLNAKFIKKATQEEFEELDGPDNMTFHVHDIITEPFFAKNAGDLIPDGMYSYKDSRHLNTGYGQHYAFRRLIVETFYGGRVTVDDVWSFPDKYADKPFIELVNFSDCDGYIAGDVIGKLAKDFEAGAGKAAFWPKEYRGLYELWREAFSVASKSNGVFRFH